MKLVFNSIDKYPELVIAIIRILPNKKLSVNSLRELCITPVF